MVLCDDRNKYHRHILQQLSCHIIIFIFILSTFVRQGIALSCYECDDCVETENFLNNHVKDCLDDSYVSCLKTESKFAHHKITSRSCSQAPSLNRDCSTHLVNIMRATVCLCSTSLCNGLDAFDDITINMHTSVDELSHNNNNNLNNNDNGNKKDSMPLSDLTEQQQQRLAAILGTNNANTLTPYWPLTISLMFSTFTVAWKMKV